MEREELEQLEQMQQQQLERQAYEKYRLEQQLRQLQGNIDATFGAIQMLQRLIQDAGPPSHDAD